MWPSTGHSIERLLGSVSHLTHTRTHSIAVWRNPSREFDMPYIWYDDERYGIQKKNIQTQLPLTFLCGVENGSHLMGTPSITVILGKNAYSEFFCNYLPEFSINPISYRDHLRVFSIIYVLAKSKQFKNECNKYQNVFDKPMVKQSK